MEHSKQRFSLEMIPVEISESMVMDFLVRCYTRKLPFSSKSFATSILNLPAHVHYKQKGTLIADPCNTDVFMIIFSSLSQVTGDKVQIIFCFSRCNFAQHISFAKKQLETKLVIYNSVLNNAQSQLMFSCLKCFK